MVEKSCERTQNITIHYSLIFLWCQHDVAIEDGGVDAEDTLYVVGHQRLLDASLEGKRVVVEE